VNQVTLNPRRIGILLDKEWMLGDERVKMHNMKFLDKDFENNT